MDLILTSIRTFFYYFVFNSIVLSLIGLIIVIALRDTLHNYFFLKTRIKRSFRKVSKCIVFNKWHEAKKELEFLAERKGDSKEVILLQCQVLRGTLECEAALSIITNALTIHPDELLFRLEKGKILFQMGKKNEAYQEYHAALPILRSETDLLEYVDSALHGGAIEEGWNILETLLFTKQNGNVFALGGDFLFEKKEFSLAIKFYQKAIDHGNNNVTIMTKLGHAYRRFGNLQEAESIFTRILEQDGADMAATLGIGACLEERGLYQKALLFFQSSKVWEKKDPNLLFQAGVLAIHTHHYAYATHYFAEVLEKQGSNPLLLTYYGFSLEKTKKYREAEDIYQKLLHEYPSHPNGYMALAWLFGVGHASTLTAETALHLANRALTLSPNSHSWEILSAVEARVGNFERAHQIQEYLASQEVDLVSRNRRYEAMRTLRKELPLEDCHVQKTLVA